MNIECNTDTLEELSSAFRFNDAVLRNMIIHRKEAISDASPLIKKPEEKRERADDSTADDEAEAATMEGSEADSDTDDAETRSADSE
jgi:small subunit ribosomal protein S6